VKPSIPRLVQTIQTVGKHGKDFKMNSDSPSILLILSIFVGLILVGIALHRFLSRHEIYKKHVSGRGLFRKGIYLHILLILVYLIASVVFVIFTFLPFGE